MTLMIQNSSIFTPVPRQIKYVGGDLVVINGANTVAKLSLCGVHENYQQYQRLSVQIPAGAVDFVLNFQQLGIKTTFVSLAPKYCGTNPTYNYLKWKFLPSSDPKWSMTSILTLSATTSSPIPSIIIDNPNADCAVTLEILAAAMSNDYLNDITAFLYLSGLTFDKVHTLGETNSGILAYFNSNNELAGTTDIVDIINVFRISGQNRLIIDEASGNDVVLDFLTEYDTLQALSAIYWVMQDPGNRSLPQAADTTPPVITKSNRVNSFTNTIDIDLSIFSNNYTKQDFITDAITSIIDARDGTIIAQPVNITFTQTSPAMSFNTLTAVSIYTATITISDIAGNLTTTTVIINAQAIIVDTIPPVIVHTASVTGSVIDAQDLAILSGNQFSYNDAKLLSILSVTDNIDGVMPLSAVSVLFFNNNMVPVSSPITQEGHYTVRFSVQDSHSNVFTEDLTIHLDNTAVNTAPEIYFTTNLNAISMTATISLAVNYGSGAGTFTKTDAITRYIIQILDDIDGIITPLTSMITFLNNVPSPITTITVAGTYAIIITVTDSGSNTTNKTITLTVTP